MVRARANGARPQRSCGGLVALALSCLLPAAPLAAQQYGQWWWDGSLGLGQTGYDNSIDGTTVSRYREDQLKAALGLNGYLGHPALGQFRLGLEGLGSKVDWGHSALKNQRLGYSLTLDALPLGSFPFHLGYRRGDYDYKRAGEDDAFHRSAYPSSSTTYEGRVRLRRGPLRGSLLSFEQSEFDFVDPSIDKDRRVRGRAEWARTLGAFDNRVHLGYEKNDYSVSAFSTDIWTANFDQFARLAQVWDWQFSISGIRNGLDFPGSPNQRIDDYRLLWRTAREVRGRDLVDLRLEGNLIDQSFVGSTEGYGATLSYRYRPGGGFEVGPYGQYSAFSSDFASSVAVRGGLSLSWNRAGKIDVSINSSVGYGTTTQEGPTEKLDETETSWSAGLTLGHGSSQRVREELELEAGANAIDFSRPGGLEEPAPVFVGVATDQDYLRGRFRIHHQGPSGRLSTWVEWGRREGTTLTGEMAVEQERLLYTLEAGYRTLSIVANAGESTVSGGNPAEEQRVDSLGASVTWRIFRYVDLRASYRSDLRQYVLLPDLEAERFEAGVTFGAGLLSLGVQAYLSRDRVAGGERRETSGLSWSIGRRFAGWLPIVTGARRRGEVR